MFLLPGRYIEKQITNKFRINSSVAETSCHTLKRSTISKNDKAVELLQVIFLHLLCSLSYILFLQTFHTGAATVIVYGFAQCRPRSKTASFSIFTLIYKELCTTFHIFDFNAVYKWTKNVLTFGIEVRSGVELDVTLKKIHRSFRLQIYKYQNSYSMKSSLSELITRDQEREMMSRPQST